MKILIGYDGSKAADGALADLRNAGLPPVAQVKILTAIVPVLPLESLAPTGDGISWYAAAYKDAVENQKVLETQAADQAKKASQLLKKYFPDWKITTSTLVDAPAHAILTLAEKWKPDLIVIGSHGWNALGKLVFGSVAEKVLNHSHCSVRLSRDNAKGKSKVPHLLVAYDGSKHAEAVIARLAKRAWPKGTTASLLAVTDIQFHLGDIGQALTQSFNPKKGLKGTWPWMEKKLTLASSKLEKAGLVTEVALMMGEPRHIILAQAKKLNVDAIFLGSRGNSTLQRFLLGSVSSSVAAHAPCSVEIVHLN